MRYFPKAQSTKPEKDKGFLGNPLPPMEALHTKVSWLMGRYFYTVFHRPSHLST
jgi:hypothetical protein